MYESDFILMEKETMTLEALRQELGTIVKDEVIYNREKTKRSVSQQPKPDDKFDTFYIRFDIKDSDDYINAVVNVGKKKHLIDYNLENEKLSVQLINYHKRDAQ